MRQQTSSVFRSRYRLTRLGVHFVFVATFTMIGGALRGFNLLLVLAGLLVGALLVQWRCSRFMVESSSAARFVPSEAFANIPFRVRYQVRNLSRFVPLWMIRIDDEIESSLGQQTSTASCGVGVVPPGKSAGAFYECIVSTRGRYRFGPMCISSLFPLSLFHAQKIIDTPADFYVFPELLKLRKGWQATLVTKQGGAAAAARRSGPNEGDFFGLREWQTGDSPRWIHHRTTARVGEPIVRQFEQQRKFDACLLVDCYGSVKHAGSSSSVETAISFAATIITSMDRSPTNRLVLAVADDEPDAASGGHAYGGKRRMLELLSRANPTNKPDIVRALDLAAKTAGYAKDLVVISPRDLADALSENPEDKQLTLRLQSWVRRGSLRWINTASAQFQAWLIEESPDAGADRSSRAEHRIVRPGRPIMLKSPEEAAAGRQAVASQDRLKLYFAILTGLGGLVLASGEGTELIPVIAVFFAAFGYVFVDWLKVFALPPVAAYILMGVAAVYCVSDFWDLDAPGNQQMLSVAQLLVMVQAILMLQKKTPRIFEQLGVFCLLELVVAAVFNDALVYGLLLLPIGLIGVWALALLSSVTVSEGLHTTLSRPGGAESYDRRVIDSRQSPAIRFAAADSTRSLASATTGMGRFALLTLTPAILLVAGVFFYALPRTTDAARMEGGGNALVGFADHMKLGQIGQMLQSSDPALRIRLSDRRSGRPYMVVGGMYLRGQVLERYQASSGGGKPTATWSSVFVGASPSRERLPREDPPVRPSDTNFYDSVEVDITCESMRNPSLFTIAPYFRTKSNDAVVHSSGRWVLSRSEQGANFYPRLRYQFGTNAFRDAVQSDMIAATQQIPSSSFLTEAFSFADRVVLSRQTGFDTGTYLDSVLEFKAAAMPTVRQKAREIRRSISPSIRTDLAVAKAMERNLAIAGGYDYTLNLNSESIPGMDPIEQFMSVDRRGHCQYFASALVMMLRSVNIPARVVVGYRTDDFSEIGQYYLARQSDAHAWVEALLSRKQLGDDRLVYGQPPSDHYWIRLDPTPGGGGVQRSTVGGVEQVFTLARDIWEEYVVDMDADRQNRALSAEGDVINGSNGSLMGWIQQRIANIRAGGLGGGSLAVRDAFSWPAATAAVVVATALFLLLKLRLPRWFGRQFDRKSALVAGKPQIPFYADTLKQISRLGIKRTAAQTPKEFVMDATAHLRSWGDVKIIDSLQVLTDEFCRRRYGNNAVANVETETTLRQLKSHVDQLLARPGFVLSTQQPPTEHHP